MLSAAKALFYVTISLAAQGKPCYVFNTSRLSSNQCNYGGSQITTEQCFQRISGVWLQEFIRAEAQECGRALVSIKHQLNCSSGCAFHLMKWNWDGSAIFVLFPITVDSETSKRRVARLGLVNWKYTSLRSLHHEHDRSFYATGTRSPRGH